MGFSAIAILIFGFGFWSVTTRITGAVIAHGKLEVDRDRQVVQHPDGGVVAEILASNGQMVAAQDVLLRLDISVERAALASAQERLFDLRVRQERLTSEASDSVSITFSSALIAQSKERKGRSELLAKQRKQFETKRVSLKNKLIQFDQRQSQIRAQIHGITAQLAAIETQLALTKLALADQEMLLQKQLSPAGVVLSFRREESILLGKRAALQSDIAEARERIREIEIGKLQIQENFRIDAMSELLDLEEPLRQFRHEIQNLTQRIANAEIRAPSSGIVYQIGIHTIRAVVRPAETLMYLVPQDRPLVIVAAILPQYVDQVRVGQKIKIRLSAFDTRTTPEMFGHITEISADVIKDQLNGGFYYSIKAVLGERELEKLPEGAVLLPGMPVETFIQTGDRSPMAYFIKPFSDYLTRAFRES